MPKRWGGFLEDFAEEIAMGAVVESIEPAFSDLPCLHVCDCSTEHITNNR